MELLAFFSITETAVPAAELAKNTLLAPTQLVVQVMALCSGENDENFSFLHHMHHQADAILHLQPNGQMVVIKNRYADTSDPANDIVSVRILIQAYYNFINATKAKWG